MNCTLEHMEEKAKIKVCHFTSVHQWNDIRIFKKMCVSLAQKGFEVHMVAPNADEGMHDGVHVISVNVPSGGRVSRILKTSKKVYQKALELDADLYHFHDPELLRFGKKMAKQGKKVIFDSHEDVPEDILDKDWVGSKSIRKMVSKRYNKYEKKIVKKLAGVISVTDPITNKFDHPNKVSVHNYPIIDKFKNTERMPVGEKLKLIYSGGLTSIRGIKEMVQAMELISCDAELVLAGRWESDAYFEECRALKGWEKVDFKGLIPLEENYSLMSTCEVGLVNFLPVRNHLNSLPNKAFEYFASGLVVQMSNLDFWQTEFADKAKYHNPADPKDLAEKIDALAAMRSELPALGDKGREFILSNRSWESQIKILVDFYNKILAS